jgi:hypothetical protein
MSLYFLTFANKNYMTVDRIINQAKSFNIFDYYLGLNELDIPEFIEKHRDFINNNQPGFGFWIWKPKIILDTLHKMKDNDILVYCDAGIYLNINGIERFKEYLSILNNSNGSMLTFSTSNAYIAQQYVKNDAIMSCYPEFNNESNIANYAGLMIIKKNDKSISLITEWLGLCENYHFLDKSGSIYHPDLSHYCGNDCDNGLFNLCLAKHKISLPIYPDETNIYCNNTQIVHTDLNYNPNNIDWSPLDKFPFQNRRMTPKFGFN